MVDYSWTGASTTKNEKGKFSSLVNIRKLFHKVIHTADETFCTIDCDDFFKKKVLKHAKTRFEGSKTREMKDKQHSIETQEVEDLNNEVINPDSQQILNITKSPNTDSSIKVVTDGSAGESNENNGMIAENMVAAPIVLPQKKKDHIVKRRLILSKKDVSAMGVRLLTVPKFKEEDMDWAKLNPQTE